MFENSTAGSTEEDESSIVSSTDNESSTVMLSCDTTFEEPETQILGGGAKRSAALYLLTLKERYRLTQTALNFAVSQVGFMTDYISQDIRSANIFQIHLSVSRLLT